MKDFERFIPNQPILSAFYKGKPEDYDNKMYNIIEDTLDLNSYYRELEIEYSDEFDAVEFGTSPVCMNFFDMIFKMSNVKSVLEIGAFIGISTMCFAKMVGDDGKVVGIEKFDQFADLAQKNFLKNGLQDRIELIRGDAMHAIRHFSPGQFDFVYIDGDKANYWRFFEMIEPLLVSGNIVVVDDVFFNGDVMNDECTSDKGQGCKEVLEQIKKLQGYRCSVLPISNGIAVLIKD